MNPYCGNLWHALKHFGQDIAMEAGVDPFLQRLRSYDTLDDYFKTADVALSYEFAPTTGRLHIHAAFHLERKISRRQLMEMFGPCDVRVMKGTPHQAHEYLSKAGHEILYVGSKSYWNVGLKTSEKDKVAPINFDHVLACINQEGVRTYQQFLKSFVNCADKDEDCFRASMQRANWIRDLIYAKSPIKRELSFVKTVWQANLLAMMHGDPKTSARKVINVWSAESGTGKTSIVDLARQDGLNVFIFPSKIADAINMYQYEEVVVFDCTRSTNVEIGDLYESMEVVSDQRLVSSGKYMGKTVRFTAHVLVFTNIQLDQDRLPGRISFINPKPLQQESYEEIAIELDFSQ